MNTQASPQPLVNFQEEYQSHNPILSRLMDEVKNEKITIGGSYDRTHNRHNRGGQ
ncbi:MAG: XRE family transcriptional regulator [Methylomarinum sp.]|nr:XRE family transcriptional regulator [Methylomarinum sp.]